MPLATLPVELWEMILDSILENIVNPVNHCDHMNFVQIDHQMRDPQGCPPIDPSYRRLRLVCRFFNDLLSPPSYLIMRDTKDQLQRSVRAVYLRPSMDAMSCLKLIIGDPSISHRLVCLDLTCDITCDPKRRFRYRYSTITFNFLCQNSPSLSAVRYLGLGIGMRVLNLQFWTEINAAFPLLVCLVLRPYFQDAAGYIPLPEGAGGPVTFEKLKILKLDGVYLYNGLHMPQLQHVALERCSQNTITTLARSRHLESALFRQMLDNIPVDLSSLPNVKLLGIPNSRQDSPLPFPRSYPSTHLCVHIQYDHGNIQGLPKWLLRAFDHMPQVSQITLDILTLRPRNRSYMEGDFRKDLELNGLVVKPFLPGTTYMVIKRAPVEPKVDPNGLWRRLTTFLRRSSAQD
jgi:hypothetical protein